VRRLGWVFVLVMGITAFVWAGEPLNERADVRVFIKSMVSKHGFNAYQLNKLFSKISINQSLIDSMDKPYEAKPWYLYQQRFLTDKRIQQGAEFWAKHEQALARAEREYGVPASIIVSIIGVETFYGQTQGNSPVLESLATFAFGYPKRRAFFLSELENYLLLTREIGIDPLTPRGSYAGAMGQGQFMPSSYRNYAVDFSGHGEKDLFNNSVDAIGSVANYFKQHGWQTRQPILDLADLRGHDYRRLAVVAPNKLPKPQQSLAELSRSGIRTQERHPAHTKAVLLELQGASNPSYYLTFENFYVITRYNSSPQYAMAVVELSQAIEKLHQQDLAAQTNKSRRT
jgi:membrane-bound lytic murein transglycosylase B